jgi:hypothetical protein
MKLNNNGTEDMKPIPVILVDLESMYEIRYRYATVN